MTQILQRINRYSLQRTKNKISSKTQFPADITDVINRYEGKHQVQYSNLIGLVTR